MSANHRALALITATLVLSMGGVLATSAHGTVVTQAWYRAGDDDPGAAAGNSGNATTSDTAGTLDLDQKHFDPSYSADVPDPRAMPLGPSLLSLEVSGGDTYYANSAVTTQAANLGIEVWAKANSSNALKGPFHLGSGANGLAIEISSGSWTGVVGGINRLDSGVAVELGEWTHLALVREEDVNTLYVNGVAEVTRTTGYNVPSHTVIGSFDFGGGGRSFDGLIDEARVFTFESRAFEVSDLNFFDVPEPGTCWLLMLGGCGLLLRRRRSGAGGLP